MEFSRDQLLMLYRDMVRGRKFEDEFMEAHFKASEPWGFHPHLGVGQEALGAGGCTFLRPDDYLVKSHRGATQELAKGMPMRQIVAGAYGKKTALNEGKGGGHLSYMERGIVGIGGTIGTCFPMATGLGIAAQRAGREQVVICFFGDGAAQRGTLHESMNWASVLRLPIIWLCENNLYYVSMHVSEAMAVKDLATLADSYAMPGEIVDGQDVVAVAKAVARAVERARKGEGPTFLECKTYRYRPHEEGNDPDSYAGAEDSRDPEELKHWLARDPIKLFRERLLDQGFKAEELDAVDRAATDEAREAVAWAAASPLPEPEEAFEGLYAD